MLEEKGATVKVCDPHAKEKLEKSYDIYDAPEVADIVVFRCKPHLQVGKRPCQSFLL